MNSMHDSDFAPVRFADISAGVREDLRLRRGLRRMRWISAGITFVLVVFCLSLMASVWQMLHHSYDAEVKSYADTYAVAVKRMGLGDINALHSISMLIDDSTALSRFMRNNHYYSDYETICYWGRNGTQSFLSMFGTWHEASFDKLHQYHQEVIEDAWHGKTAVSEPFYSEVAHNNVMAYAAPVYNQEGLIVGAVTAIKRLSVFSEILDDFNPPDDRIDLALISPTGRGIAWNGHSYFGISPLMELKRINFLSEQQRGDLRQAIAKNIRYSIKFEYDDTSFSLTTEPVGFAGWQVLTISSFAVKSSPLYTALMWQASLILLVLITVIAVNIFAGILMGHNYRRQISLSFYDPLTHGFNLRKFALELANNREVRKGPEYLVAINVHEFRFINEFAGSRVADELLKLIHKTAADSPRIRMFCRELGDQFYLLIRVKEVQQAEELLMSLFERVSSGFAQTFTLFPVSFYAGVLKFDGTEAVEPQLHRANLVQRSARKDNGHSIQVFSPDLYQRVKDFRALEQAARTALEKGQFKLYLQPKFDLLKNRVEASEALVRWQREDGSVLQPGQFLPAVEHAGLSAELDLYMLEQACVLLRSWLDEGLDPVRISVNQCKQLLFSSNYFSSVQNLIQHYRIPPRLIVIEVLESVMAQDLPKISDYLKQLRAFGVEISIDDFGTGYSSLNMLSSLQADEIKFDRTFLLEKDPEKKDRNKMVLRYSQSLARIFNARTVVEGVENSQDADFLRTEGFDLAQGYYYSRPIPSAEFTRRYIKPEPEDV